MPSLIGTIGVRAAREGQCATVSQPPPPEPARPDGETTPAVDPPDVGGDSPAAVPAAVGDATITPYRDGPLIVRGNFRLVDQDGAPIDPGRDTIALCRCGKSGIKPFCDGTHKRAGFSAPSAPSRPRPSARISAGPGAPTAERTEADRSDG